MLNSSSGSHIRQKCKSTQNIREKWKMGIFKMHCVLIAQLCLTLCDPRDCSPPGFSVHGIFPGKNTGVVCHLLLQGIFPTQGLNPSLLRLLHWKADSLPLSHLGSLVSNIDHKLTVNIIRVYCWTLIQL